jgi:excisionase family DNA binding protein
MLVDERRPRRQIMCMPQDGADDLLFLDEVAQHARVSIESVRHWIKAGRLPSVRPGKRRMVRRSDLDVFMGRNRTGTEAAK